jgi:hypothetical protein
MFRIESSPEFDIVVGRGISIFDLGMLIYDNIYIDLRGKSYIFMASLPEWIYELTKGLKKWKNEGRGFVLQRMNLCGDIFDMRFNGMFCEIKIYDIGRNKYGMLVMNYKEATDFHDFALDFLIFRYKEFGGNKEDIKDLSLFSVNP